MPCLLQVNIVPPESQLSGTDRSAVQVIPYCIDSDFFREVPVPDIRERLGLGTRRVILFQGRLSPEKGPQLLMDALPTVIAERSDCRALFVGPDEGPGFDGPTCLVLNCVRSPKRRALTRT